MSRFRAAIIHLGICIAISLVLLALFWLVWYPPPLFRAFGGRDIFFVLLAVDVILGPALTLIVFKADKKSLTMDLSIIAMVQAAALTYGVWVLLAGRPAYVAALGGRFDAIQANEVAQSDLDAASKSLPKWGPEWVGIKVATDRKERERILFSALAGADYGQMPQYHAPLESMRDEILKNAQLISELRKKNTARDAEITAWLRDHGQTDGSVVFQGLKARAEDMAVILDAKTAKVIGIAPFKPWD